MISLKQCVIVEGKYDKQRLEQLVDAVIIPTDGFRIFKDREKRLLIRSLAEKNGLLILTDSDSAGFIIRNHIKSFVPASLITNVYIPQLIGKEKRKTVPSKEGLLGVEGMDDAVLLDVLHRAGVAAGAADSAGRRKVTKLDLYEKGFSGSQNSAKYRQVLLKRLGLPSYMTANALLEVINSAMDFDSFETLAKEITANIDSF